MRYLNMLAVAFVLTACVGPFAAEKKAPLDDKTFVAVVTRDGKAEVDELVFKDGTFISADAELQGFTPTAYTTIKQGEFMKFEAIAKSEKSGTMTWTGTVKGDVIKGKAVLDAGFLRRNREYPFQGKLKD
jgi:hypothetical protein